MNQLPALSPSERARYQRHLTLPELGEIGQQRLKASSVLLVGVGGLGSPAALYLAAAGVGRLGLIDGDRVETSNLQRQLLFGDADVGRPKVDAARSRLAQVNPHVSLELFPERLTAANARARIAGFQLVLDGTDNFASRYLIGDACALGGRPLVQGSLSRFEGQVTVFAPPAGPCHRCLFPEPPPAGTVPNCAEAGVVGVIPGLIGTLMATEAIKLLAGIGDPLIGRLLRVDALRMQMWQLSVPRDPHCRLCSAEATIHEVVATEESCSVDRPSEIPIELTPRELAARWQVGDRPLLLDVREPFEWARGHLEGAVHIPLGQLPARLGELDPASEWVVYCAVGGRSAHAAQFLRQRGFQRVLNLDGGIIAWAAEVDPTVMR